jgi:hypothetical protein
MKHYEQGSRRRLKLTNVRDEADVVVDAATVKLRILPGRAAEQDYLLSTGGVEHDGVGAYSKVVTLDTPGLWRYRWETTQPDVAGEGHFFVDATVFP